MKDGRGAWVSSSARHSRAYCSAVGQWGESIVGETLGNRFSGFGIGDDGADAAGASELVPGLANHLLTGRVAIIDAEKVAAWIAQVFHPDP